METGHPFAIRVTESPHGPVVLITGELDLETAPQLHDCLANLTGQHVTLDFSDVTFMDSTAINVLVEAHKRGDLVVLRGARPAQMRVFEILGLVEYLNFDGDSP